LYREALPGLGPRAFLLHGMLSSSLQWRPNLPSLSRPAVNLEAIEGFDAALAQCIHQKVSS
jgi:hypothetical protein